jgi:hypothetical protein
MVDFREEQRIDMWWVRLTVLAVAAMAWLSVLSPPLFRCEGASCKELAWLPWVLIPLIGVGLPLLFFVLRLTVTIDADGVHVRYYPFIKRQIAFSDIESFCARRYRPIREFGGWGIRSGLGKKAAYNAKGDRGVELYLRDGHSLMLGSQRPKELAAALRARGVAEITKEGAPEGSHWLMS